MTPERYHRYFREYENDPDLCPDREKYIHYVYSKDRVDRYIRRQAGLKRIPLAILLGDGIIGEILIKNIEERRSATLSIALKNAAFKDHGYGTRAERLAVQYVFNELDIPVLYADALRTNTRSQHVLEKAGFTLTGEDADFKYYKIVRQTAGPPAAP